MEELTLITWETIPNVLLTIAVAIIGVGRLTRIVVFDDFPPAAWWREVWVSMTDGTGWEKLFICWWCFSAWVALACIGWYIAGLYVAWVAWAWWIFWGWMALSYLAPMLIVRDDPEK